MAFPEKHRDFISNQQSAISFWQLGFKRLIAYSVCVILLVESGCNLEQQPPATPTIDVSETQPVEPDQVATRTPPGALATLLPTPTQLTLMTLPPPPGIGVTPGMTVGPGVPTMDAALADQRYEIEVRDGRTVGVNYNVTIIRGSVLMVMQGPDGVVWQKTLTTSETSRAEVTVQQGGTYEVLVDIQNFDGQFELSWD